MNEKIIQDISLTKLRASNTNPRKHFDEAYIAELGESIRQKGIIQPLTVRPDWCIGQSDEQIAALNGDSERKDAEFFEIVAGECRFRGAARASLADVPAIVRHLSDKETLEIQIIENLQRSDLTPLEEAEGYRRLIDEYGYTVQDVHVKTGKDKKTIYGKLKILKAPKILLDALIKKIVTEGHCELVGRIPSPDMREAAAREILQPKFLHENRYGGLERVSDQPMGLHVARAFVRDNFMRSLAGAQFDQNDASLVVPIIDDETGERIGGGACDDCPMRSGNRPDLTGELKRPDMCTNPKCFAAKTDAFFVRLQETAKKEGKRLLSDDECAEIFEEDGSLSGFTQYVKLSEQPPRVHVRDDVKKIPSWKKLMEECGEGKPEILIGRDPKGRIVELVDFNLAREAANIAAKSKGETSIFEQERKPSAHQRESAAATAEFGGEEPEWKKQERKNREIAKLNFQVTLAGLGELLNGIAGKGALNGLWDAVIEIAIGHAGHDGCWLMCKLLDLDPKMAGRGANGGDGPSGAVSQYARGLTGDNKKIGFLTTLLLSKDAKIYNSGSFGGLRNLEGFKPFAKLYKIDINEIEKRLKSVAREKTKAKKKSASRTGSSSRTGDGSPDVQTSSKKAKNATPPAAIVDPTQEHLEKAFSAPEIAKGTIREPVIVKGKQFTVSGIEFPVKGPPIFDLVELIPASEFKGKTRDINGESEKAGPLGYYFGVEVKYHGAAYVLGFITKYRFSKIKKANGASRTGIQRPTPNPERRTKKKNGKAASRGDGKRVKRTVARRVKKGGKK